MNILFTCGGTAGHVNPAVALARMFQERHPGCQVLFVGADGGMECDLVPREGYPIKTVTITNFRRKLSPEGIRHNVGTLKNLAVSRRQASRILDEFRPDLVVGTGGYASYPVVREAARRGIPTAVHESNAVPGLTTKRLSKVVDKVMVGFEDSRPHYPHPERVVVTGTPVRGAFAACTKAQARQELGLAGNEKLVVSVWGSLGAGHMNGIMTELIPLLDGQQSFRLLHAAGKMYYPGVCEKLAEMAPNLAARKVDLREYIFDMPRVMAAADLVLCRAGASTISELTYMGKPVIMVPSPNVTNHHQERNARVLEKAGGAKVLLEGEFDAQSLLALVQELLADEQRLSAMSAAMRSLAVPDATDKICGIIMDILKQ